MGEAREEYLANQARLRAEQIDSAERNRESAVRAEARKRLQDQARARATDKNSRDFVGPPREAMSGFVGPIQVHTVTEPAKSQTVTRRPRESARERSRERATDTTSRDFVGPPKEAMNEPAKPRIKTMRPSESARERSRERSRDRTRERATDASSKDFVGPPVEAKPDFVGPVQVTTIKETAKDQTPMARRAQGPVGPINPLISRADQAITGIQERLRASADEAEAKAFESKAKGQHVQGLAQMTASQWTRAGAGFVGGVTFPLNPIAWGQTITDVSTLATDPEARSQVVANIRAKPHHFVAEVGGGILGGMAFGAGAEAVIKKIKGPTSSIEQMRRATALKTTKIKRTGSIIKESFEEVPGASVVDDFSLSQYEVQGGKWGKSGSTPGFGKRSDAGGPLVHGRTGPAMTQMLIPEGTPASSVFKLVKRKVQISMDQTRIVKPFGNIVTRIGPGAFPKMVRTVIPATSPPLVGLGGALGLMSGARSRTQAGDLTQQAIQDQVMTDNRWPQQTRPRDTTTPQEDQTQRGRVIQGGLNLQKPQPIQELYDPGFTPGPDPVPQKTRTRTTPILEPIYRQDPEPIPDQPRPIPPPFIPRRTPGEPSLPPLRMDPLMRRKKRGLWDPMSLKRGLKTFNVKKAKDVV